MLSLRLVAWLIVGSQVIQLLFILRGVTSVPGEQVDFDDRPGLSESTSDVPATGAQRVRWVNLPPTADVRQRYAAAVANECPLIWMVWSTGITTFGARQRAALQSLLYHHPCANVTILSNALDSSAIAPNWRRNVRVAPYDDAYLRHLVDGIAEAEAWVARASEWRAGQYYFSHLTDLLRFALLYRYGGFYSDFDAIYMRSLMPFTNAVGWDLSPNCFWEGCVASSRK